MKFAICEEREGECLSDSERMLLTVQRTVVIRPSLVWNYIPAAQLQSLVKNNIAPLAGDITADGRDSEGKHYAGAPRDGASFCANKSRVAT